jgi:hypothetical protein
VEMRGQSVLRCKPCGHFLPEPARRRKGRATVGAFKFWNNSPEKAKARLLEPIGCERVKQENWTMMRTGNGPGTKQASS